jgi:putative hydrolase of the HAD superfamily
VALHGVKRYRHIFFDLDGTLWDLRANTRATLNELHAELGLGTMGIAVAGLIQVYEEVNQALWAAHETGGLPKDVLRVLRFRRVLAAFGINDGRLADRLSREYLHRCPRMGALVPGAAGLLAALVPRYRLHILTNGFEEVQRTKLTSGGILGHFTTVTTSEAVGAGKPSPKIFHRAAQQAGARADESLMIGDSIAADMAGARAVGWDHVHFAAGAEPDPMATYRIRNLGELTGLLLRG